MHRRATRPTGKHRIFVVHAPNINNCLSLLQSLFLFSFQIIAKFIEVIGKYEFIWSVYFLIIFIRKRKVRRREENVSVCVCVFVGMFFGIGCFIRKISCEQNQQNLLIRDTS